MSYDPSPSTPSVPLLSVPTITTAVNLRPSSGVMGAVKIGRLRACHPKLNLSRVRDLKALYHGGCRLLGDREVMARVFPMYTHENPAVYAERIRRAFYENVFAMVINQISAGLAQDPARFTPEDEPRETDDEDEKSKSKPKAELDQYWKDISENATALSADGRTRRTFDQVTRDMVVEGLVAGWAWVMCDLPRQDADPEWAPRSLYEQEQSGDLRAYVVPWPTECVTDWSERDGELLWVRTYECRVPDEDPLMPRDRKIHVWTFWFADTWVRYELEERANEAPKGDEHELTPTSSGTHSFGRVPWTCFDTTSAFGSNLHVGDVIESLCRSYFNRQNGESFQWIQFYYQQLYEFLGPEVSGVDTVVSDAQTDAHRAKRTRSPGQVHVRGADDRAEFVGPNMQGADVGRNALQDLRDSILRTIAQMALAQDTSGAMLRRSGDSKRQDSIAQEIILGAIGKLAVSAATSVASLLAAGRGDAAAPKVTGYQHFNVTDAEQIIAQDAIVESMDVPSARFQIERKYQMAAARLGDAASQEILDEIRQQLEGAITQDQLEQLPEEDLEGLEIEDEDDEDTEWDEDEDDEDEDK